MHKKDKKFEINEKSNRYFSVEFKKAKAKDIAGGKLSINDACRLYEVSRTSIYKWLYLYTQIERGTKTVLQMDSEEMKTKKLLDDVADLERKVGQKQLEIDYLNKLIEISSNEIGFDIKKKAEQALLSGSEKKHLKI